MKNPLPFAVVSIRLAVLVTLAHLVHTGQLLDDGRSSFFFLYAASFLLYAISSLSDPGYLKSCPLAYLPNDERAAFEATLSERTGEPYNRKDVPAAFSTTHDEITSSDSLSSETVSTNGKKRGGWNTIREDTLSVAYVDELDSLTIFHHKNHNTVITERRVWKKQKGATTMRCVHRNGPGQPDDDDLPSTNQTKYSCRQRSKEGVKFEDKSDPKVGRRVHLRLITPLGIRARVNENGPSKYKPLSVTRLHHVGLNAGGSHAEPTHVKKTIRDPLNKQTPITCYIHGKKKPSTIFRVRGGQVYQYGTPLSYCYVCGVVQILRSRHCNACHRCVRTFDHHCPWINNCVAENNRASYLVYLLFEAMALFHALKLLSQAILRMLFEENGWFLAWLVVLLLVLFFFFTMISCLAIYHSYLCLINETTRENTLRARSTQEVKNLGRKLAGPFFLGYQQNVLIYFSNLPIAWICPKVVRQYASNWLCRTRGVTWATHGEILWKPNRKPSFPSQAIFLSILEHVTSCLRRQLSPVTLSIEIRSRSGSGSRFFSSIPTELTNSQQKLLIQLAKRTVSKIGDGRTHQKITKIQERSKILKNLHDDLDVYAELFQESGLIDEKRNPEKTIQEVKSSSVMDADDDIRQLLRSIEDVGSMLLQDVVDFYKSVVNTEHHLDTEEVKVEITPGVGGLEAKLFCNDLFSIYEQFCKMKNFQCNLIKGESEDVKDGFRSIVAVIKGERVYEHFVQENGIHRVQRIPVNSKKIQTSTSVVFVSDEESLKKNIEKKINFSKSDLLIETKRSGGAGGQSVNKNETCVRILHKPTNLSVEVQKTSSQIQNRSMAIQALKNKLFSHYYQQEKELYFKCKKSHKMSGDRSEKIRTYNFVSDFITDHLTNVQYPGIDLFFRDDGLVRLVDHHRKVFYQHIVDETLRFILDRTQG
ncbi:Peptide release factor [Plasmodium coatneyi]|uniref:Peptide release factor n=1 Tax=Plasmodium coatneyi TaxID=208452 RepID=A0A1B1DXN0_9APIC|nr:Peptide release factor [Plasmodium coatneyi]ANQ07355.1 Peptide release factor [Plasmodium coatneyi]